MTIFAGLPISVVVPTVGREKLLRRCLTSILTCDPPAAEVLVVDQSGGGAVDALAQEIGSQRIRVVPCDGRGVARATNVGLRHALHDLVLVTHDDCTVDTSWVEVGHRLGSSSPGALFTGRVLAPDGSPYVPTTREWPEPQEFTGQIRTGALLPNNMVAYRSAIAEIGGFDERKGLQLAAEDNDLCYRWLCSGRRLRYEPKLVVWHHDWRTPAELVSTHKVYLRSQGVFFAKYLHARDPHILELMDVYLRWAIPTFYNGVADGRPRWEYAERELPYLLLGMVQGWREAARLERKPEFAHGHFNPQRVRYSSMLMRFFRRSLGAQRRRLLGLEGLDPHLGALETRSSMIEARLSAIEETVRTQNAEVDELAARFEPWARAQDDHRLVVNYLASAKVPILHLGCGDLNREGWLNTDVAPTSDGIMKLDMRGPYPFPDESFRAIYTEHSLEHLDLDGARQMLAQCHRVLAGLGVLRIATPDLRKVVDLLAGNDEASQDYVRWACKQFDLGPPYTSAVVINNFFHAWGHQLIYDEATLTQLLSEAGFDDVQRMEIGKSRLQELCGAEMRADLIGEEQYRAETMVLEARKRAV